MALIRLDAITKTYQRGEIEIPVLRGVSLSIDPGELVALMGASGSGKTTLMNIVGCLDRPTSGHYWLDGEEISQLSADRRADIRNRKIGFVFQNFNLLPRTSALENVMMPLTYSHRVVSDREAADRAGRWLHAVGLADRIDHQPSQLSGGQQQRVAIARALVNEPALVLADEPTANLDSETAFRIIQLMKKMRDEFRTTFIFSTHDPRIVGEAEVILTLKDGRLAAGEGAHA
jgi:ABC-type lipoprotein export system ATPase subunit